MMLRVWNAATGECERTLEGHTGKVTSLAVLGDGRVVSGSDENTLRVWNADTGECCRCVLRESAEGQALLNSLHLQHRHARLVASNELHAAGSCLVGPGFARTYVDTAVKALEFLFAPTSADGDARQAAAAHTVVAGTASGAVHFFAIVR
jgi:hypothetical protein